jgi:hypothetical protein
MLVGVCIEQELPVETSIANSSCGSNDGGSSQSSSSGWSLGRAYYITTSHEVCKLLFDSLGLLFYKQ